MQNTSVVILAQTIMPTVVVAISTSEPQTSYIAKPRCPGPYAELHNQCLALEEQK